MLIMCLIFWSLGNVNISNVGAAEPDPEVAFFRQKYRNSENTFRPNQLWGYCSLVRDVIEVLIENEDDVGSAASRI